MKALERIEKSPLDSKKFIAFLVGEFTWKAIILLMLITYGADIRILHWAIMLGVVLTAGFIEVGYILGQASLDKFTRLAQINASLGIPSLATPDAEAEEPDADD